MFLNPNSAHYFLKIFSETIEAISPWIGGILPDEPLAVGVSGGPDSLALCYLLQRWSLSLGGRNAILPLIVDHNLQDTSLQVALEAKQKVEAWGLRGEILTWNHGNSGRPTAGIMEKARKVRYKLLGEHCRKKNARILFCAHHEGDNVETVWMRKIKNSHWRGLAGISPISLLPQEEIFLLRPLLNWPKFYLEELLRSVGISWFLDPANTLHARGKVRSIITQSASRPWVKKTLKTIGVLAKRRQKEAEKISKMYTVWTPEGCCLSAEKKQSGPLGFMENLTSGHTIALPIVVAFNVPIKNIDPQEGALIVSAITKALHPWSQHKIQNYTEMWNFLKNSSPGMGKSLGGYVWKKYPRGKNRKFLYLSSVALENLAIEIELTKGKTQEVASARHQEQKSAKQSKDQESLEERIYGPPAKRQNFHDILALYPEPMRKYSRNIEKKKDVEKQRQNFQLPETAKTKLCGNTPRCLAHNPCKKIKTLLGDEHLPKWEYFFEKRQYLAHNELISEISNECLDSLESVKWNSVEVRHGDKKNHPCCIQNKDKKNCARVGVGKSIYALWWPRRGGKSLKFVGKTPQEYPLKEISETPQCDETFFRKECRNKDLFCPKINPKFYPFFLSAAQMLPKIHGPKKHDCAVLEK